MTEVAATDQNRLTHLDDTGKAHMVDVGAKRDTERVAVARGAVLMREATLQLIASNQMAKGDAVAAARIAGIMAAKKTSELVPLCHPLMLTQVNVDFELQPAEGSEPARINIEAVVRTVGKTGVEMEALTAVAVAGLTIYDMGKAVDRAMRITDIRLVRKVGGKSGEIVLEE